MFRVYSVLIFILGMGLIGLPLNGQIQSSIQLNYTSALEDSLILAREADTLAYYRSIYLEDESDHSSLNAYLEALNRCFTFDSLEFYLSRNIPEYRNWEEKVEQAKFLLAWANAAEYSSQFDSAETILRLLVEDTTYLPFQEQIAKANFKLGVVHRLKGEYYLATRHIQEALDQYTALADSQNIYDTEFQIGILDLIQGDSVGFEESYQKASRFFEKEADSTNLALVYSIRSIFLSNFNRSIEGLDFARRSLEIRYALEDVRGQAESLNNAAINIMALGDLDRGKLLIEEALRKFKMGNYLVFVPTLLNNLGRMKVRKGDLEEAMPYYEEALAIATKRNQRHDIQYSRMRIARLCAKLGDFKCAYEEMNQSITLNSEIIGKEQLSKVNDLRAKYKDERDEQELAFLKREKEIIRVRDTVVIVSLLILLVIAGWLILVIRKRGQQERRILLAQEANARQELELAEQKLEAGRERLTDFVSRMVEKSRMVEELEEQVKTLEKKVQVEDQKRLEFESQLGNMKILTQEDWDEFRSLFKKAHPGYLDRLSKDLPHLSKGEMRIFVLIYLDLTTPEAAAMLGISPSAVKKARYRLKKKLELPEDADLKVFVQQF